jgi:hypothetical protein
MTDPADTLTDLQRQQVVADLASFAGEMDRLLNGHPNEALTRPSSGGGWGVVEVLSHLLDWEEICLWRLEAVLLQDTPDLPAYDGALWDIEHDYRSQDPRTVLARFTEARRRFVALLEPLDEAGWQRGGNHSTVGPVTVEWLATHLRDHSREHIDQVREALA